MPSVKAFVYNPQTRKILVLIRSASNPRRPLEVDFPGGKIEDGEDPATAIKRELYEETGLEAQNSTLFDQAGDAFRFIIEVTTVGVKLNPRKHQSYKWADVEDLVEFPEKYQQSIQKFTQLISDSGS